MTSFIKLTASPKASKNEITMTCCWQYLVVFASAVLINGLAAEKCLNELGNLADCQQKFVYCTVDKSTPKANSCVRCYTEYTDMVHSYKNLSDNCAKKLLDKNRLNIVYNMQKTLLEIWNKQFCDDCFLDGILSNSTDKFQNLKNDYDSCVQSSISAPCNCEKLYTLLNDFYRKMDKENDGKICFDLQDSMNATRFQWSKELNCCHREFNPVLFFVASSMFAALPLIFYTGMYMYAKRSERNHAVIDSTFDSDNQVAGPSRLAGISSAVPSDNQHETVASTSAAAFNKENEQHDNLIKGESSSTQPIENSLIKL